METMGERESNRQRESEREYNNLLMLSTESKVHEKIGIFLYHINIECQKILYIETM